MKKIILMIAVFSLIFIQGCSSDRVEMVDLDRVLDIMAETIESLEERPGNVSLVANESIMAIDPDHQSSEKTDLFLVTFENNLNSANLISDPIRPVMDSGGTVVGYNGRTDQKLFTIELDSERNRMIATDTQNSYRRDRGFPMGGMFMGYMMGSMLGRQRFSGISPSRYSNMKMNKKGYHKAAVASRTTRTSARSKSRSNSFRTGK